MIQYFFIAAIAYLLGSIPWGFLAGKLKGVDVRDYGSGKTGATNVLRTLGTKAAALVLLLDVAKGVAAVLAARAISPGTPSADALAGFLAIVGHNWPVFLGFHGGRGVTTGEGTLLVTFPWAGIAAASVFVPVVLLSRYVSLGSVMAVLAAAVGVGVTALVREVPWQHLLYAFAGSALILFQSRDNIQRLLAGKERRLGQRAEKAVARSPEAHRG